jgi:hypothetical protein
LTDKREVSILFYALCLIINWIKMPLPKERPMGKLYHFLGVGSLPEYRRVRFRASCVRPYGNEGHSRHIPQGTRVEVELMPYIGARESESHLPDNFGVQIRHSPGPKIREIKTNVHITKVEEKKDGPLILHTNFGSFRVGKLIPGPELFDQPATIESRLVKKT